MPEIGFEPLTLQMGIPGTSYRIQLGLISKKWAIRILKGKEIINAYIFSELKENQLPQSEEIIKWILTTIPFDLNPIQVSKTVQVLLKEAKKNREKNKLGISIEEVKKSKEDLKEVPESELTKIKIQGRVIESKMDEREGENLIRTLKENVHFLEKEIETIKELLKLTDIKIKHLEDQLVTKEVELKGLHDEFVKQDAELEILKLENEKLRKGTISPPEKGILDFSKLRITKSEFINNIKEILKKAQHNVIIIATEITEFQELKVYKVRTSVNLNLAAFIDFGIKEHEQLYEELNSFENIIIKNFEDKDRYGILRDGEELLFAAIGINPDHLLTIHTTDSAQVNLLKSLITDPWLRSKKI